MATKKKTIPAKKGKTKPKGKKGSGVSVFAELWQTIRHGDSIRFVAGVSLMVVSLFMLLSFVSQYFTGSLDQTLVQHGGTGKVANYAGRLGAETANFFMEEGFGTSAFFIPIFFILVSVKLIRAYKVRLWKCFIHCGILLVWLSVTLALVQNTIFSHNQGDLYWGGLHGLKVCNYLEGIVGTVITYALVIATAIFYLAYLSSETVAVVRKMLKPQDYLKQRLSSRKEETCAPGEPMDYNDGEITEDDETEEEEAAPLKESYTVSLDFSNEVNSDTEPSLILDAPEKMPTHNNTNDPEMELVPTKEEEVSGQLEPYNPRLDLEHYKFPTLSLLKSYPDEDHSVDMQEQNANKDRIINVLRNFGVEISSIKATIGPTITLYEITPAPGIKISKIRNLEDDIALSLAARGIRIIAPIPGKGTIGIEVPNKNPRIVSMESILNTKKFQESSFELPVALGKTITNEVFMIDLAKMPHLLVAGATGQGKSVGLNAIITSLLYKKHPAELKIVMVDPKKVEFSIYGPIEKHFLAMLPEEEEPIITDVTRVVQTLKSLCQLMDHRYDLLKRARVRDIRQYNEKFLARQLNPENGHEYMPYIVIIIDEFGDLIMTAGKEVELPIARIAQLARAVGMHMVIATQRPTTNIITGTIKANFPARMAFKVSSRVDSQTILDRTGANQLVGRGDMLFLTGNEPVRVQCAFVDTPEVESICDHIAEQQGYITAYELPEVMVEGNDGGGGGGGLEDEALDPMFAEAARLIVVHQSGSTSLIQRKFAIGYNRAGRLMDQLERAGIVGPTRGAKPREVLCADETDLEIRLSSLQNR